MKLWCRIRSIPDLVPLKVERRWRAVLPRQILDTMYVWKRRHNGSNIASFDLPTNSIETPGDPSN